MSTKASTRRSREILEKIGGELARARLYFAIAAVLHEKYLNQEIDIANNFYYGTYQATFREAVLSLSKLVLEDPESITFKYLLDHMENHPIHWKFSGPAAVRDMIAAQRRSLKGFSPLFRKIRTLRDRDLAHFDRKHINDPAGINPGPVEFSEIGECFEALMKILNDYQPAFGNSQLTPVHWEHLIAEEINNILDRDGTGKGAP